MHTSQPQPLWKRYLPVIVVSLASMFYVYEFFVRVIPMVITDELMVDMHIDAASLGLMVGAFYYAYTPMQIPAGMLCDRFGPRVLLTLAILVCGLGTYGFAMTHSVVVAGGMRFLIGAASAFAFVGPLALTNRWFHPKHFALIAGLIQLMGSVGAIVGGEPVARLAATFGWRPTAVVAAWVGLALAVLFALILRDRPNPAPAWSDTSSTNNPKDFATVWQNLKTLCRNPQTWWVGLVGFSCWGPISTMAELWGVPFIQTDYGVSSAVAANAVMWVWLGIAVGSPLAGWWSDTIRSRRIPLITFTSLGVVSGVCVVYAHLPLGWPLDLAMCALGMAASSQPVTFGLVNDHNDTSVAGTALGFNNMAVIAGGSVCQPLAGILLQSVWHGTIVNGVPHFTTQEFQHALWVVPFVSLVGLWASLTRVRETHCKPVHHLPNHESA